MSKKIFVLIPTFFTLVTCYSQTSKDYYNRGIAKDKAGDFKGAIVNYNKALEIKQTAEAYFLRAMAKSSLKDYTGAIADLNNSINITPTDNAYYLRVSQKSFLKDYRGAIDDYSKAIESNPKQPLHYAKRGIAKLQLGQKDSGCLDLSKAGELGYAEAYRFIEKFCN